MRNNLTVYLRVSVLGFALAHTISGREVDTCVAVRSSSRVMDVRGTAELREEGLIFADYTCPVAQSRTDRLAAMILVNVETFASEDVKREFNRLRADHQHVPVLQAVVHGVMECRPDLKIAVADDGTIMAGAGFGPFGLVKCRITGAELRFVHAIASQDRTNRR